MPLTAKRPSKRDAVQARLKKDVTGQGTSTKRLNVDVPADLYRQIRERALQEERSVSDITRILWTEYLSK